MPHFTKIASALKGCRSSILGAGRHMLSRKSAMLSLAAFCLAATSYAQGTWTPVAGNSPDYNQGVMVLLTDGSVMVKSGGGGGAGTGSGWNRLTPDVHGSYVNGSWTATSAMLDSRLYFSTQVLKNGSIYAAGGEYGTGRSAAEVYLPIDDMWLPIPGVSGLTDTFSDANSELLPDGKVLQAVVLTGHTVSHHTYIYDPATSTFTTGPNTIGLDNESSWVKQPDNSILFPDVYTTHTERYIPATNTWITDSDVPLSLYDPYGEEMGAAFLLPDGRSFFMGSTSTSAYYTPSGTTANGTWSAGPAIPDSLGAPDAAAAMMTNGKILCAFSHTPTFDSVFHNKMRFYEFDYLTNTYTLIASPEGGDSIDAPSYVSNMLCLPDGSVLYARQGDDQFYVYKPATPALAAGKPIVDSILLNNCDTFVATGTLFNGITEGAGYGDDWQMATNYPIIRLSRHDTVYYATTYNWNSTGVMRGTARDTTQFVVPAGIPHGTYQLQVIANGNASDPVPFSFCDALAVSNVTKAPKHISVYPNPASTEVTIDYNAANAGTYTLKLTDLYGRVVIEEKRTATAGANTTTLQLTGLARGVYTASINDGTTVYNTKVVIK